MFKEDAPRHHIGTNLFFSLSDGGTVDLSIFTNVGPFCIVRLTTRKTIVLRTIFDSDFFFTPGNEAFEFELKKNKSAIKSYQMFGHSLPRRFIA